MSGLEQTQRNTGRQSLPTPCIHVWLSADSEKLRKAESSNSLHSCLAWCRLRETQECRVFQLLAFMSGLLQTQRNSGMQSLPTPCIHVWLGADSEKLRNAESSNSLHSCLAYCRLRETQECRVFQLLAFMSGLVQTQRNSGMLSLPTPCIHVWLRADSEKHRKAESSNSLHPCLAYCRLRETQEGRVFQLLAFMSGLVQTQRNSGMQSLPTPCIHVWLGADSEKLRNAESSNSLHSCLA